MPLPFAPPPSESKLYRDLKNIKVDELTADQFDSLKGALFAQGVDSSEDEMRRLNLVGEASNQTSSSGVIPGTIQFKTVNGVNNATSYINFGEGVWRISDIIAQYTGGSGNIYFRAYYYDQTAALEWFYGSSSSATAYQYLADSQFDEVASQRYGGDMYLGLKPSGTFDADSMTIYVVCYRVR